MLAASSHAPQQSTVRLNHLNLFEGPLKNSTTVIHEFIPLLSRDYAFFFFQFFSTFQKLSQYFQKSHESY